MRIVRALLVGLVCTATWFASACDRSPGHADVAAESQPASCASSQLAGEVHLSGGEFVMGAAPERDEEAGPRRVAVGAFSIDTTEVTNTQFAAFVDATGYVTQAERPLDPALYPGVPTSALAPSALVFVGAPDTGAGDPATWWRVVEGANWKHPEGPGSSIAGRENHPVVLVGHEDALAYAHWRGRDLPTEAEWEFAARGGAEGKRFEWGDTPRDSSKPQANTWEGLFPVNDSGKDGYRAQTAPVGCYPANAFGLHDMTGNVWEWTADWYPGSSEDEGSARQHLIKGGSFLCADNFCLRYRPGARQAGPPDTGASHVGFRTVKRAS
jgi:sulfatase modifying factor 1